MNHEYVELWYFVKDNWFVLIAGISFFVGWACLIIKAASNGHVSDDCDDHLPDDAINYRVEDMDMYSVPSYEEIAYNPLYSDDPDSVYYEN